jgi:hypothetical protein
MSGTATTMQFDGVQVYTNDRRLTIQASGGIDNLKDKYKLNVHFNVQRMTAENTTAERIIKQFAGRKFMMKQFRALGTIGYQGHFEVLYRREQFAGHLTTAGGPINFRFSLDENNKYVTGTTSADGFRLGQVMDMKNLGDIACEASFRFDYSKQRTAAMRKLKGGKLPIGNIDCKVIRASYGIVKAKNVSASIQSDGAIAQGKIYAPGKILDLGCTFSFTNTDQMNAAKIKPVVKLLPSKSDGDDTSAKQSKKDKPAKGDKPAKDDKPAKKDKSIGAFFKNLFSKSK